MTIYTGSGKIIDNNNVLLRNSTKGDILINHVVIMALTLVVIASCKSADLEESTVKEQGHSSYYCLGEHPVTKAPIEVCTRSRNWENSSQSGSMYTSLRPGEKFVGDGGLFGWDYWELKYKNIETAENFVLEQRKPEKKEGFWNPFRKKEAPNFYFYTGDKSIEHKVECSRSTKVCAGAPNMPEY